MAMSSPFVATYPAGGIPTDGIDIPVAAVLLLVYLCLGIVHGAFFFKVSKRTFAPHAFTMGFCFSRVATMALRIAWATHPTNKNIAIAANVFLSAGVLIIYLVNMIFTHRFVLQIFTPIPTHRGHPFNMIAYGYMFSVIPLLILVIVPAVQLFFTSNLDTIHTDRKILRFAQVYLTVFVAIQIPASIAAWIAYLRKHRPADIESREVHIRFAAVCMVAALLLWIQAVKLCQTFYTPNALTPVNPPWFLRRPILYAGIFLPEILCVIIYALARIRLRFQKPNRQSDGATTGKVEDTAEKSEDV